MCICIVVALLRRVFSCLFSHASVQFLHASYVLIASSGTLVAHPSALLQMGKQISHISPSLAKSLYVLWCFILCSLTNLDSAAKFCSSAVIFFFLFLFIFVNVGSNAQSAFARYCDDVS